MNSASVFKMIFFFLDTLIQNIFSDNDLPDISAIKEPLVVKGAMEAHPELRPHTIFEVHPPADSFAAGVVKDSLERY